MRERTMYPATHRTSVGPAYALLGPCPCKGCGQPVWWAHSQTRDGWNGAIIKGLLKWRESGGRIHKCIDSPLPKAARKMAA